MKFAKDTDELLSRRVAKIIPDRSSLEKLLGKRKIKVYQGFDPTGSRLHLGHSIGIRKLMDFANLGHEVIFLFGTGTVLVGDPSQRATARKLITQEEIDQNIRGWKKQVSPLVDWKKVKILKNGDWLTKLTLKEIINISSNISAIQLFKRDMFIRRIKNGDTVWYHETLYPLLQGYDSVVMDVDLEIGGTDQEFNMLVGRELAKKMKNKEKFIMTTPMILGVDGQTMSKSSGNCIWLDDSPNDMFAKVMSIVDSQIIPYMELVTDIPLEEVRQYQKALKEKKLHPMLAKKILAESIVNDIHGSKKAKEAKEYFENVFQKKDASFAFKQIKIPKGSKLIDVIAKITGSRSQAKRLITQRAVDINGQVAKDPFIEISSGDAIKIGKKEFIQISS
jgi:tyrosyl-tRNA synthetase